MKNINGFLYNCAHINKNNFSNIKSKSKRDFIE